MLHRGTFSFTTSEVLQHATRCPPKKVQRLINNKTKAFCLISDFFVFDKQDPNLDFDILFFSVEGKSPELCELKHKNALNHETRGSLEFLPSYA